MKEYKFIGRKLTVTISGALLVCLKCGKFIERAYVSNGEWYCEECYETLLSRR